MKQDKSFEYKVTFFAFIGIVLMVLFLSIDNCNAQSMDIPIIQGDLQEGATFLEDADWSKLGPGDPVEAFPYAGGEIYASTSRVEIGFKIKKRDRILNLTYPVDSISWGPTEVENIEEIIFYFTPGGSGDKAEKLVAYGGGKEWKGYVYYPDMVFYFKGEVY